MTGNSASEKTEERDSEQVGRSGSGARIEASRTHDKRALDLVTSIKNRYARKRREPQAER
jgi:hypothetical protein